MDIELSLDIKKLDNTLTLQEAVINRIRGKKRQKGVT
jgi:hypothetical protein